jgi:hypothetical protein
MKNKGVLLVVIALAGLPLFGQQPAVKRHPGEHIHYRVTVSDGEIEKITHIAVNLQISTSVPHPDQPAASLGFGGNCGKSADPKIWDCDVPIPPNVADGDYRLFDIQVGSSTFLQSYEEDFHVPLVPVENPNTFKPPTKVIVTPQP